MCARVYCFTVCALRRYNIRYGRVDASDDEVQDAAIAADIHERILSFTNRKLIFVQRCFLFFLNSWFSTVVNCVLPVRIALRVRSIPSNISL